MKTLFKKSLLVLMIAFIAVFTLGVTSKVKAADAYYEKVTSAPSDWSGTYLIVYESGKVAFDGSRTTLDAASNTQAVTINDNKIEATDAMNSISFTITKNGSNYNVKSVSGYYIGQTSNANGLKSNKTTTYANTISINSDASVNFVSGGAYLRYNSDSGQYRFRYYKSGTYTGQKAIHLYKYVQSTSVDPEPEKHICTPCPICGDCTVGGELCTSDKCPTHSIKISSSAYTQVDVDVTLNTSTSVGITDSIIWDSSNTDVATIENGVVKAHSVGKTTITATAHGLTQTQEFKVYPTEGSELTIAEAVEICKLAGNENSPYKYKAQGIVSEVTYNDTYLNYTFKLTDESDTITVYGAKGDCELEDGYKVEVYGELVNYNLNTPEFAINSTFERVVDNSLNNFLNNLDKICSHMSLAYKYSIIEVDAPATTIQTHTMEYKSETTGNMKDGNNAATVGLNENIFTVTSHKGSQSNHIGLNKEGSMRLYANKSDGDGSTLTVKANGFIIKSIEITFGTTVGKFTVNGIEGSKAQTTYQIGTSEFSIKNINTGATTQVHIFSIKINLEVENENSGAKQLAYENVDFRIKCGIDSAIENLADLPEGKEYTWGIEVSNGTNTKYYTSKSEYLMNDSNKNVNYVVISLGDIFDNCSLATAKFTVRAYVEVDGQKYYSSASEEKAYSVKDMLTIYSTSEEVNAAGQASVNEVIQILNSLGC